MCMGSDKTQVCQVDQAVNTQAESRPEQAQTYLDTPSSLPCNLANGDKLLLCNYKGQKAVDA